MTGERLRVRCDHVAFDMPECGNVQESLAHACL